MHKPVRVPFFNDDQIYWTPLQAQALKQSGIETPGALIKKPSDDHRPGQLGFDKNAGIMRSNFKLVDKWDQLRDLDGIIEIPFKFDSSFAYTDLIKDQIRGHLGFMNEELGQCLKFKERNEEYLMAGRLNIVASGSGCWSYIGRVYYDQDISLGDGCHGRGRSLHEFMHALGFLHEHQRADRDDHIEIHWENIKTDRQADFAKLDTDLNNNQRYDPFSLLHYGTDAFTKNGKDTFSFKNKELLNGKEC